MASTSDYDEELNLSYHLLHHYGNIVMHSRMVDSHIYIMKKWIIDFLNQVRIFAGDKQSSTQSRQLNFFY